MNLSWWPQRIIQFLLYQQILFKAKAMPRGVKKENLPSKVCLSCDRPFTWRKKWERCWDEVTTCSKSCNVKRRTGSRLAGAVSYNVDDQIDSSDFGEKISFAKINQNQYIEDPIMPNIPALNITDEKQIVNSETGEVQIDKSVINDSVLTNELIDSKSDEYIESNLSCDTSQQFSSSSTLRGLKKSKKNKADSSKFTATSEILLKQEQQQERQQQMETSKRRSKLCEICKEQKEHLFRCQWEESRKWRFVCKTCWPIVSGSKSSKESLFNNDGSARAMNPLYVYGGTWKA